MTANAVDVSNFQAPSQAAAQALRDNGITKVIVGLQYPANGSGNAHEWLEALIAVGMPEIDVYFESTDVAISWGHIAQYAPMIHRAWLACETGSNFEDNVAIDAGLAFLDSLNLPEQAGIYTGAWWWNTAMQGVDWYKGRKLWVADYNLEASPRFAAFGGWDQCEIHQFDEHGQLPGVGFEIDLDYYDNSAIGQAQPATPLPSEVPAAPMTDQPLTLHDAGMLSVKIQEQLYNDDPAHVNKIDYGTEIVIDSLPKEGNRRAYKILIP